MFQDTTEEVRTNSYATFSYGFLYVDVPVLSDQHGLILALCGYWMKSRRPGKSDRW